MENKSELITLIDSIVESKSFSLEALDNIKNLRDKASRKFFDEWCQVHYCRHRHLTPYGAMRCAERHFAEKEKTVKVHKQFV